MRRSVFSVLAALTTVLVFVTGLLVPKAASATSIYDNDYTTVDSLFYGAANYYGFSCTMQDVSGDFLDIFSNSDYWVYSGEYDSFWPTFEEAMDEGSWAVGVQQHRMNTGYDAVVYLAWNSTGGELVFNGGQLATSPMGAKYAQLYMYRDLFGYGGCTPAIRAFDAPVALSTYPGVDTSTTVNGYYSSNYFAKEWAVTYPSGYAGEYIRDEPPTPVTTPYTGTINCTDGNPVFMLIYQLGNNGTATLSSVSSGAANWSYNLTSSPYQATIQCGSTLAASVGTVDPLTSSTDWVCDTYAIPPYCVLS